MEKKKKEKEDKNQPWTPEQEKLLASWSEKAAGYRWLHTRSEKKYRKCNYAFTIPVIILSTLTGTANFAMDSFVPEEHKQMAMACVGGVNIFAGILSTLQNFLRYAELMEGHRVAEVSWSKFSREISVELALEPKMRKPAFDFLTICRAEYDRLIEQSPTIDDSIIKQYNHKFKNIKDIDHPHVCNGLHKVIIYEPKKEEKVAEIIASAGNKLVNRLNSKKWDMDGKKGIPKPPIKSNVSNFESKKELDSLKSIGKVKNFKEMINKGNEGGTHIHELKSIMKKIDDNDDDDDDDHHDDGNSS